MRKILIAILTVLMVVCSFGLVACGTNSESGCKHESTHTNTVIEATCTKTGLERKICNDCGKDLGEKTTSKLSHTPSGWIIDINSTCYDVGSKHKECIVCEEVLEEQEIAQLSHNFINGECTVCGAQESLTDPKHQLAPLVTPVRNISPFRKQSLG